MIEVAKYLGVWRSGERFKACIRFNGKQIFLGRYKDEIDAAKAYNEAAIKYHGEFANPNIL
jgi:hypothetical protein